MPKHQKPSDYCILIIDDEPEITYMFSEYLSEVGYKIFIANTASASQDIFKQETIDIVLLDINMPKTSGSKLLGDFKKQKPEVIIIMVSAIQEVDMVVKCMHMGAYDYLVKPIIELNQIKIRIERALSERATLLENKSLKKKLSQSVMMSNIIAQSPVMDSVMKSVQTVAQYDSTVLITGVSGTGKELIAQTIHDLSKRSKNSFIAVNCGSIPQTLLESTLFGHEKGAFTGAINKRIGLFEESSHGTILLDEITETSPDFQVQLLRVLENNTIRLVGSPREIELDLRIIAATNQNIETLVEKGKFREDLYYRLNVFRIALPPLKERKEDIPLLTEYYLHKLSKKMKKAPLRISSEVLDIFQKYPWQGNIRELINCLENAIIHCNEGIIKPHHLPDNFESYRIEGTEHNKPDSYQTSIRKFDLDYFADLLRFTNGNITKAASIAGYSRPHLHIKIKSLGLKE
ncbi:MAG: sigma-54-dependent Fis family transcriptional regulator [Candidatus Marinimicrobia bacterium]|nr:sigma-54-dependent Fis family transcriptional regulator [Candidatus Neomarinimicrobiota bacterium]